MPPFGVNLIALLSRFQKNLLQARRIARDHAAAGIENTFQTHALCLGGRLRRLDRPADEVSD